MRQLLLQARFVEPDDPAAVLRPAHVVVSVLAPAVLKLQGHQEMRGGKICRVFRAKLMKLSFQALK